MPELLSGTFSDGSPLGSPLQVLVRLVTALVLGFVVAWVYRQTHSGLEDSGSFRSTLVLLAILIAMVTQVIGDNVARAFSLVGALAIVRFRTVVRDTRDTAFVIFAVVVGMAVGAADLWVALIGLAVAALAAFLTTSPRTPAAREPGPAFVLRIRLASGRDVDTTVGTTLDGHLLDRRLVAIETAKQGMSIEVSYEVKLQRYESAHELVKALNRLDGVQSVELAAETRGRDLA